MNSKTICGKENGICCEGNQRHATDVRNQAFVQKTKDVATAKATKVVDTYATIANNGYGAIMDAATIHPNDTGHNFVYIDVLAILNS